MRRLISSNADAAQMYHHLRYVGPIGQTVATNMLQKLRRKLCMSPEDEPCATVAAHLE